MKNENYYQDSMRYIDNARENLKKAGKDGNFYIDEKYVKAACGIAHSGMLKALDFLFDIKNVQKKRGRKSIEYYRTVLSSLDKKFLSYLNSSYNILHLSGYYDGEKSIKGIEAGFDSAISIIDALKPYSKNGNEW